ncbi:peroxisomal membrane protein 11C-like isoform X1 [Macrobrachium nipponense]|uniref:peroxisomal membrane protein 11C-like isoform X1 n=2 Tax=Macrobrachium nipponense TaxID=159736 RepID=UPI0030C80237
MEPEEGRKMSLQDFVSVLESYRGREKTMRTVQYGLLLMTPFTQKNTRVAAEAISAQLGSARVILRLFDDLSMLQYSLSYGLGKRGEDRTQRLLKLVNNIFDMLYYPVEHIAWLQDMKVLRGKSQGLWNLCIVIWAISLSLTIVRALHQISILKQQKAKTSDEERRRIEARHVEEYLTVIMQGSDLLNAINWLPWRPWSKPFASWQVGLLGLTSSIIGFRKLLSAGR